MLCISRREGVKQILLHCPGCGHSLEWAPLKQVRVSVETSCEFCGTVARVKIEFGEAE